MDDDNNSHSQLGRWAHLLLRGTASAAALLACAQPVLAGGFLDGHYSLLAAHRNAAMILAGAILLSLVAALLLWRPGHGPGRPALACAVAFVLCGGQIGLGFARVLIIHIPLGIALLVLVLQIALAAWRLPPARRAEAGPAAGAADLPEEVAVGA